MSVKLAEIILLYDMGPICYRNMTIIIFTIRHQLYTQHKIDYNLLFFGFHFWNMSEPGGFPNQHEVNK